MEEVNEILGGWWNGIMEKSKTGEVEYWQNGKPKDCVNGEMGEWK